MAEKNFGQSIVLLSIDAMSSSNGRSIPYRISDYVIISSIVKSTRYTQHLESQFRHIFAITTHIFYLTCQAKILILIRTLKPKLSR